MTHMTNHKTKFRNIARILRGASRSSRQCSPLAKLSKREHLWPTYSREATDLSKSVQARKIIALARWRTEENDDVSYFDYRDTLLGWCVSVHQLKLRF